MKPSRGADEPQRLDRRPVGGHRRLRRERRAPRRAPAPASPRQPSAKSRSRSAVATSGCAPGGVVVEDRARRLGREPQRQAPRGRARRGRSRPRSAAAAAGSRSAMSGPSQGSSSRSCSARSIIRTERTPGVVRSTSSAARACASISVLGRDDLQRRGVGELALPGGGQPAGGERQRQRQHREEGQDRRRGSPTDSADARAARHQPVRRRGRRRSQPQRRDAGSRSRLRRLDPAVGEAQHPRRHPVARRRGPGSGRGWRSARSCPCG